MEKGETLRREFCRLGFVLLLFFMLTLTLNITPVKAEPNLINVLKTLLGFTNIADSTVETFPPGTYNVTLYAEYAGYYATNNLSWYLVGKTEYNLIFSGPEGSTGIGLVTPPLSKTFTANSAFGLSLATQENHRYFTQNSLNPDYLPDHINHSKVYANLDNTNMFLIGFENLFGGGDKDFQDMVVSIEFNCPLPPSVGGEWVPTNKFNLLAPWMSSASLTIAIAVSYVFIKRKKRQN